MDDHTRSPWSQQNLHHQRALCTPPPTATSVYAQIPVNENNEFLPSSIHVHSSRAHLICKSLTFVCQDEAPMVNRAAPVPSLVDDLPKDIMHTNTPFRSKVKSLTLRPASFWSALSVHCLTIPVRNTLISRPLSIPLVTLPDLKSTFIIGDIVYPQSVIETLAFPARFSLPPMPKLIATTTLSLTLCFDSLKVAAEAVLEATSDILDYAGRQSPPRIPKRHRARSARCSHSQHHLLACIVGVDLSELYTTLSRISHCSHARVYLPVR